MSVLVLVGLTLQQLLSFPSWARRSGVCSVLVQVRQAWVVEALGGASCQCSLRYTDSFLRPSSIALVPWFLPSSSIDAFQHVLMLSILTCTSWCFPMTSPSILASVSLCVTHSLCLVMVLPPGSTWTSVRCRLVACLAVWCTWAMHHVWRFLRLHDGTTRPNAAVSCFFHALS